MVCTNRGNSVRGGSHIKKKGNHPNGSGFSSSTPENSCYFSEPVHIHACLCLQAQVVVIIKWSVCILSGKIQVYNWAMISFKPSFFQVFLLWWILEAPLYHSKCHPAPLLKTICDFPLWRGDLKTRLTKHVGCQNEYKTLS